MPTEATKLAHIFRSYVATTMQNTDDLNGVPFYTIEGKILADYEMPDSVWHILADGPCQWIARKQLQSRSKLLKQPIRCHRILLGDVTPNPNHIFFGLVAVPKS